MSYERRKVRVGRVVSDKMDKSVVVVVEWRRSHRIYTKPVKRQTRFAAHDPNNECRIGDMVRIRECRPLSKTKRWRVEAILQSEDIAELQPEEIAVEGEGADEAQNGTPAAVGAEVGAAAAAVAAAADATPVPDGAPSEDTETP